MPGTRLFLIRHAIVEPSARAILYGSMDVALCDLALREEAALYRWLAARLPRPAAWVTSALSRTRATAAAIFAAGYPEQPLTQEPDLAEQHLGDWQGITHEQLTERLRRPPHPFWPHAAEERPPGGESFPELQARVAPVIERLAAQHEGGDVVIVAHGGSIRAALAHAIGLTPHQALAFSIRNLGLTRLEKHGPDWRVAAVNEEPWNAPLPEPPPEDPEPEDLDPEDLDRADPPR
ncbi:MAG TPA: histidine phosphatase family protein [Crenalkalicoccus sp.]|nr:histidine phosphatase family protein [Crenalkalicoccus sp.]